MKTESLASKINPFAEDIIVDPRKIYSNIDELNKRILDEIIERFSQLEQGELPRKENNPLKTVILLSPRGGYGKSHLLGRLFRELDDRATLIYLRPYQDPCKCWHSILDCTVKELDRPDNPNQEDGAVQLLTFSYGVLAHLLADCLADEERTENNQRAIDYFRSNTADLFQDEKLAEWKLYLAEYWKEQNRFHILCKKLEKRCPRLKGQASTWLTILFVYAFAEENSPQKEIIIKWLKADPLEEEERRIISLESSSLNAQADMTSIEINELSFKRLQGLCALSGFYRPFLFCFDQTEYYADQPHLLSSLRNCLEKFFADLPHQFLVVTCNTKPWNEKIRISSDIAYHDRYDESLVLEGINKVQAVELVKQRLIYFSISSVDAETFCSGEWFEKLFSIGQVPIRAFLQKAREEYGNKIEEPLILVPIAELFKKYVNKVRSQKSFSGYHQDALMWFVQKLFGDTKELDISLHPDNKYLHVRWVRKKAVLWFAFEGGDNCSRWAAIAREAVEFNKGDQSKQIVMRTPNLPKIPKESWKAIKADLHYAQKKGFTILLLTQGETLEIYAARELYADALQNNIDYEVEEIRAWLKHHFKDFLDDRFFGDKAVTGKVPKLKPDPTKDDSHEILSYIEKMRFLDIKQIKDHFDKKYSQDQILRAVGDHPSIHIAAGPKSIVLQWIKST